MYTFKKKYASKSDIKERKRRLLKQRDENKERIKDLAFSHKSERSHKHSESLIS